MCLFYLVNPVVESGDTGEDSGFLLIVAAKTRDKAGNAMHLPGVLVVLAVKGATGVALDREREEGSRFTFVDIPYWVTGRVQLSQS